MTSQSSSKGSKGQGPNVNMPGSQSPTEVGTVVHVTQEDMEHGHEQSCESCPVALATSRATGKFAWVRRRSILLYASKEAFVNNEKHIWIWKLPLEVVAFIDAFDDGQPVSPFSFTIPYSGDSK